MVSWGSKQSLLASMLFEWSFLWTCIPYTANRTLRKYFQTIASDMQILNVALHDSSSKCSLVSGNKVGLLKKLNRNNQLISKARKKSHQTILYLQIIHLNHKFWIFFFVVVVINVEVLNVVFVCRKELSWLFSDSGAYQLLQVYQTIWQFWGKNWEMLGWELQLNPVRPINPKREKKIIFFPVTKPRFTFINRKKQSVKTNLILTITNNPGNFINGQKV